MAFLLNNRLWKFINVSFQCGNRYTLGVRFIRVPEGFGEWFSFNNSKLLSIEIRPYYNVSSSTSSCSSFFLSSKFWWMDFYSLLLLLFSGLQSGAVSGEWSAVYVLQMGPIFYILIALPCTVGAIALAILHIYRHLLNYTEPTYQRYIVRIIFMVPVSISLPSSGLFSLVSHQHAYSFMCKFQDR